MTPASKDTKSFYECPWDKTINTLNQSTLSLSKREDKRNNLIFSTPDASSLDSSTSDCCASKVLN